MKTATLHLSDGSIFSGTLFGAQTSADGEVVFNTTMTGYEQSLTDPSYRGQILVFTFPMLGNYGIPTEEKDEYGILKNFESDSVHVRAIIVSECSRNFSHHSSVTSLDEWARKKNIPVLSGVDTRALTQKLRETGVMLGQIVPEGKAPKKEVIDPNAKNLVAEVSLPKIQILDPKNPIGITILAIDTGIKNNILREFLRRGVRILRCPWNTDIAKISKEWHALFLSNGPGDPSVVAPTISIAIAFATKQKKAIFGICLGNQLLALSVGAKTFKMKYGHRGGNQPCQNMDDKKAVMTSQNHGFAIDDTTLPSEMRVWFTNINDGTVEGILHKTLPIFSVQFHPEACPGPQDTKYLFDLFVQRILEQKKEI